MARGTVFMVEPWGAQGQAVYDYCLCSELARLGLDLKLVTNELHDRLSFPRDFAVLPLYNGIRGPHCRARKGLSYFRSLARLFHAVRAHRPAVVHFQFLVFPPADTLAIHLIRGLGARVLLTVHDIFCLDDKIYHVALVTKAYEAADALIVHSQWAKGTLIAATKNRVSANRVHVIPHGNYELVAGSNAIPKAEAKTLLGIDSRDKVVLFFGSMLPYKGLDTLIEAFPAVVRALPRARLLVASHPRRGMGDFSRHAARIAELDIESRVTTDLRYVPDTEVPSYFHAADAVALPYKRCYTPGVAHLALSCGRPVVAMAVGGIPDVIRDGDTGFLAATNDAAGFAAALTRALSDEADAERAGLRGKELMEREHTWPLSASRTVEAYREARAEIA